MAKLSQDLKQLVDIRVAEVADKLIVAALKNSSETITAKLEEYLTSPAFIESVNKKVVEAVEEVLDNESLYDILSPKQYNVLQKKIADGVVKTLGL